MAIRRLVVHVTTAGNGTATAYSPYFSGRLTAIHYVKTDFANGVDFAITKDVAGDTLWAEDNVNATKHCYPRAANHSTAGAALVYVAAGTAVMDLIRMSQDRAKIAIVQGGGATTGVFHFVVED